MSLATALFTPAQGKVLVRLFETPGRWYHVNELIRETGLGSASLQRELKRLEAGGLLDIEAVGNLKRVRANTRSPVFPELQSLVRKTLGTVPALRAALTPLTSKINVALVYGSVARGTDHAQSDVDLMVVSDELSVGDLLPSLLDAEATIGRKVSPTVYTRSDFERRRDDVASFVSQVLSGPHEVILGEVERHVVAS